MRATCLQSVLERLTAAIRDVETELAELRDAIGIKFVRAAAALSNQASLAARASNDWRSMLIMVRIVF